MYTIERKSRIVEYSLYLGCLLSNISQLPYFVNAGLTQVIAFPGWILLLISVLLSKRRFVLHKSILPIAIFTVLLVLWCLVDTLITESNYFSSSMIYCYAVSLFIMILGAGSSEFTSNRVISNVIYIYIISLVIVSGAIFVQYFGLGYNLATRIYAYSSKNSISQLVFNAILFLLIRCKPTKRYLKVARLIAIVFEIWIILLLRSRATIVSLVICIVIIAFSRSTNKKVRVAVIVSAIIFLVLLFTNNGINNFIFNNVLFAGRSSSSLNELTSGRVDILESYPARITGHWLTGIGATYYECFPLSAILQFGLPGGIIIILVSLIPLYVSFKMRRTSDEWFLLFLIAIGYSVNGLFEGLTPLGPGVKCYFMWLLFGILSNRRSYSQ